MYHLQNIEVESTSYFSVSFCRVTFPRGSSMLCSFECYEFDFFLLICLILFSNVNQKLDLVVGSRVLVFFKAMFLFYLRLVLGNWRFFFSFLFIFFFFMLVLQLKNYCH